MEDKNIVSNVYYTDDILKATSNTTGTSITFHIKCIRCGRTDLPIRSNGLCTRCDDEKYGKQHDFWPIYIPPYQPPYYPQEPIFWCVRP
jgi:ribosomal protein L37E